MPGIVNKIIVNDARADGDHTSNKKEYDNINFLGNEAKDAGMPIKDLFDCRDKLEASCDKHTKANREHLDELRDIEKELRHRIDNFLSKNNP